MDVSRDGGRLKIDAWEGDEAAVQGFHERYSRWTGRAALEVVGPGARLPIGPGYGAARARLREWFPKRPYTSDWIDGRFPSSPAGAPPDLAFALGVAFGAVVAGAVAGALGPLAGAAVAVAAGWPVARLRDAVVVRRDGLVVGPPWSPRVPWHEVEAVRYRVVGRRVVVWVKTRFGGGAATLPVVLLPALKARLWRLGGVEATAGTEGVDERYDRWRGPATGIPWGILAGTAVATCFSPYPMFSLTCGLMAMAGTALLGAAVEARATGWGMGGVIWATGAYGVVLAAIALGFGGWMGGS